MDLKISHPSLKVPATISQRCKAYSHENVRWFQIKATTKDIKNYNFSSKLSTTKLFLPLGLYGKSNFLKSLQFSQHKANKSIRASGEVEYVDPDPVAKAPPKPAGLFAEISHFGSAFHKFIRPYAMYPAIIANICLYARVMVENKNLFHWSLLLKAFPGLLAIIFGHIYNNGINQIYDIHIDRVNKSYLPLPSGDLSLKQAWFMMISVVLGGMLICRFMNADPITVSLYCFCLLLVTCYSAPPFRFKGSSLATLISLPVNTIASVLGVLYTTKVSLGLPFVWSPANIFICTFTPIFFVPICLFKDIPDVEGDMKHNVRTFAAIFGPKNINIVGTGILILNYTGAIAAGIFMPQAFNRNLMVASHSILSLWLLYEARKMHKENYTKEASTNFYVFLWKILTLEYLVFPFI